MNEFDLIARFFAPLAGEGAFGLKDDVALVPQRPGHDVIVTTDTIGEGTDFFAFDPAGTVAQKALRVNLSDLAANDNGRLAGGLCIWLGTRSGRIRFVVAGWRHRQG